MINSLDTNKVIVSCGNFDSPGAGLYRTTNGGNAWDMLGGLTLLTGKTMLGMYAANPNVVYASVADSTTGIGSLWRTTN